MVKKVAARLLKTLIWVAVALLVTVAVLVGVARELVSGVGQMQSEVASYLKRQTGLQIEFDDLQGSWKGLTPRFQLHNFRISQDDQHLPAIVVRDLNLEILLLQTVLHWQPQVRLDLDGALMTLIQKQGKVMLEGIELNSDPAATGRMKADDIAELISAQPRIAITDSRVVIKDWYDDPIVLHVKQLKAEAGRINRYLAGDVVLYGPTALAFQVRGKLRGSFFLENSATGEVYLDTAHADWLPWLPADKRRIQMLELASLQGGGEIWLHVDKGRLTDATTRFVFHDFNLHSDNEIQPPLIKTLAGVARWQKDENGGWRAGVEDFRMVTPRFNWQPSVLTLSAAPQADGGVRYGLALDDADITPWLNYYLAVQPEQGKVYETLKALRPAGKLQRLVLFLLHKDNMLTDMRMEARVEQFNSRPWEKYPGFRDLDIHAWGINNQFIVRLNDDYLELNYPYLFRDTLVVKHMQGTVAVKLADQGVQLQSGLININTDDMRSATQFSLEIPADKTLPPFMQLQATLRDIRADKKSLYLPAGIMSDKLLKWLDESILSGKLVRGDILVHGPMGRDYKADRRVLLGFSVSDADLQFLPDWQEPVRHADADVIVDRGAVQAIITKGEYFGQTLNQGSVDMAAVQSDEQPILHVNVQTQGDAQSGFNILQTTPLANMVGESVQDMALKGDMAVDFALAVPLKKGDIKTQANVDVQLQNGEFTLVSRQLHVTDVNTQIHFDLVNGLSSPGLTGKTLGGDVAGSIKTESLRQGGQITQLNFSGKAEASALRDWLKLSLLAPLSGELPYDLEMQLPLGEAKNHKFAFLNVTSNLRGALVDLPAPFGKTAKQKSDFRVWMSLSRAPALLSVRYGNLFEFSSQSDAGKMQKAALNLGKQKAVLPGGNYFALTGHLQRFSNLEWMPVWEQVKTLSDQYSEGVTSDRLGILDHSSLSIDELVLGGKTLGAQKIDLQRQPDAWSVQLRGDFLNGWASIPFYVLSDPATYVNQTTPMVVQLEKVQWPKSEELVGPEPPWQAMDLSPLMLPPANITIDRLMLGDGNFGYWNLKMRRQSDGMVLKDVTMKMRSIDFFGQGMWSDVSEQRSTSVWGDYRSDNIANVMRDWGSEPTMNSKKLNGSINLQWPGSPFEFALSRAQGKLDVKVEDGSFFNVKSGVVGKFWSALNFETLLRRLRLNFKDLQDKDMVYDEIKATAQADNGILHVENLQLESPTIKLQTSGDVDLHSSEMNMVMKVTVPVTRNLVLPAAAIGGVPAAATAFVIEKVLGSQFDKLTTIKYSVKGGFDDPQVTVMDSFSIIPSKVRETVMGNGKKDEASQ